MKKIILVLTLLNSNVVFAQPAITQTDLNKISISLNSKIIKLESKFESENLLQKTKSTRI